MTPREARIIIHQCAKQVYNQGRSADEFMFVIDYSPWTLGESFNTAIGIEYNIIEHVIALVWQPTQHCG